MTEQKRTQQTLIETTSCRRCGDPIATARGTRLCGPCEIWGCRECYDGIYRVDNDADTREQGDTTEVLARCTECGHEVWEAQEDNQ